MKYEPRTYRRMTREHDLYHFRVIVGETDLDIAIDKDSFREELKEEVKTIVAQERQLIQKYNKLDAVFATTLQPHCPLPGAPASVEQMCAWTRMAGVGPMAAVAGFFSELAGNYLSRYAEEIIVENGGDIWLKSTRKRTVAVYAGKSPLSCQIGIVIDPKRTPLGICTSSGTVGHSLSFGQADAAVVLSPSVVLADAAATAAGNMVQKADDLAAAVRFACSIPGITGALTIVGDRMAVLGEIELAPI